MTDDTRTYEVVDDPFAPWPVSSPSQELLDMLHWLKEAQGDFYECMEFNTEELKALGELTPRQVDTLLTRGSLG